jgi:Fic family protein
LNYELLSSLYYKGKKEYEQEYNDRFNSVASKRLNISIEENQCFYILTEEVVNKLYNVMVLNQKLDKLTSEIPGIALQQYIKKCLIDEIVLTNEIEGVVSTRKDINEILENVEDKNKRLTGLVNKYLNLCSEENIDIITCNDVRNIYNDLLWEEISEDDKLNLPDGVYFRKEGVDVLSSFKNVIHKGVMPEEKINLMMTQALNILNDRDIIPILRIAIFHYLFGYIHPFYDGNGRTSRFISSYLLSKELNTLTGFGLSYAIKENISQYYKGFKTVNEKKNKGDLTPFIISFLDILSKELESLNNSVIERINIINRYSKVIEVMEKKDKQKQNIIYVIFQETLFGEAGIDVSSLMKYAKASKYKVTQVLKEYDDMLIKNKIGRKNYYSFDLAVVDEKYLD